MYVYFFSRITFIKKIKKIGLKNIKCIFFLKLFIFSYKFILIDKSVLILIRLINYYILIELAGANSLLIK